MSPPSHGALVVGASLRAVFVRLPVVSVGVAQCTPFTPHVQLGPAVVTTFRGPLIVLVMATDAPRCPLFLPTVGGRVEAVAEAPYIPHGRLEE